MSAGAPRASAGYAGDDRGQTVLDYAIGVGLFFVALVFVLGTIPGMFTPFAAGTDAQVGDRVATSLASDRLGDPSTPYLLDTECTWEFFDQMRTGDDAPATCRYDTTVDSLQPLFGLDAGTGINVSVTTLDGTTATLANGGPALTLAAGDAIPSGVSVTTARRNVRLEGATYRLEVHVW